VAGVLGDHPSMYSRSPALWNAAFAAAGIDAAFVPFDVAPADLEPFLGACRGATALLGFSVTVPHKERTAAQLDSLDGDAVIIGAVNTVVRLAEGRLVGANTDGAAALRVVQGLLPAAHGQAAERGRILLLGAGGAARAVGVVLGRGLPAGEILVWARREDRAEDVAAAIRRAGGAAAVVEPSGVEAVLPDAAVLINATSVGMSGPVARDGGVTWLESYSPLGPADPPVVGPDAAPSGAVRPGMPASGAAMPDPAQPPAGWWEKAWPGIARNLEVSLRRALQLPPGAAVLDLVYAPAETVLLKHARWTGHPAHNGLGVLVEQAVDAFFRICRPLVADEPDLRRTVREAMKRALQAGVKRALQGGER